MGCPQSKEKAPATGGADNGMGIVAKGFQRKMQRTPSSPQVSVMTGSWEVPRENIDADHHVTMGEGDFGLVYQSRAKLPAVGARGAEVDYTPVAVKKLSTTAEKGLRSDFLTEIQIMKEADHPNLLRLLGVVTVEAPLLMLFELPSKGSLKAVLVANRTVATISDRDRASYGTHVAEALAYLVDHKVIHGDLAARNCMVTETNTCKVGDYGLSRKDYSQDYVTAGNGSQQPLRWMSPAAIASNTFDHESDVWAFGVLLWEVASFGNQPYPSHSTAEARQHILDGNNPGTPKNCSIEGFAALMAECWLPKGSRATFKALAPKLAALASNASAGDSAYNSDVRSHRTTSTASLPAKEASPASSVPVTRRQSTVEEAAAAEAVAAAAKAPVVEEEESPDGFDGMSVGSASQDAYADPQDMPAAAVAGIQLVASVPLVTESSTSSPEKDGAEVFNYDTPQIVEPPHDEARKSFQSLEAFKGNAGPGQTFEKMADMDVTELSRDSIDLLGALGKGAFGVVMRGLWSKPDGSLKECAIKTLKEGGSAVDREALSAEARLVAQFNHPNVVACYGQVTVGEPAMIVFEFMEHGSLWDYLKKSGSELALKDRMKMAIDIAQGMCCLEANKHVHRDLAARNVLVGAGKVCKISDFGLSRDLEDEMYYESEGGMVPIRWTPPEAYKYKKYSSKSDVWSYGILLYEIWTKAALPYGKDWTNLNVMMEVERGYRLQAPPDCPRALYKVMMDCWNPMRACRPDFKTLVDRMKMAFEMLFTADGQDMNIELETDDLTDLYMGVPVPTAENLDDAYLAPTPLGETMAMKTYPTIEEQLVPRLIPRATVPEVELRKSGVMNAQARLSSMDPNGIDLRKQRLASEEDEAQPSKTLQPTRVEYVSHKRVAEVLKLSQQREKLSDLQKKGISIATKEGVNTKDVDVNPEYIERVGRAREVTATVNITGRGKCVCRRFKCVCNLD